MNFSCTAWVLKENKHTLTERMEKEKAISESTVNSQQIDDVMAIKQKFLTLMGTIFS